MGEVRAKRKYRVTQLIENSGAGGMGKKKIRAWGCWGMATWRKVTRDVLGVTGMFTYCGYSEMLLTFVKTH